MIAYGPADATATPSSLASLKSRMVQAVLVKRSGCECCYVNALATMLTSSVALACIAHCVMYLAVGLMASERRTGISFTRVCGSFHPLPLLYPPGERSEWRGIYCDACCLSFCAQSINRLRRHRCTRHR